MSCGVLARSVSFFVSALANRRRVRSLEANLNSSWWKAMLLVCVIFAFFSYKGQLGNVGDALLETHSEKAAVEPKEPGKL